MRNYLLTANGIGARTFATDFRDEDISSAELGFTFGGKKVLRRLLRVCVYIALLVNEQSLNQILYVCIHRISQPVLVQMARQ